MKRILTAFMILSAFLTGCGKDIGADGSEGCTDISFGVADGGTRAESESGTAVRLIQYLVFSGTDSNAPLEAYATATSVNQVVNMRLTKGTKTIHVLVNWPECEVASMDELDSFDVSQSDDTVYQKMSGMKVFDTDSGSRCIVQVYHLYSCIRIDKVSFDIPDAIMASSFSGAVLDAMCVLNTPSSHYLTEYYGSYGFEESGVANDSFERDGGTWTTGYGSLMDSGIGHAVSSGTYGSPHFFYCLPCMCEELQHILSVAVWLPSVKRVTYYNIPLGSLKHNTTYRITSLNITGMGSDDPLTPTEKCSVSGMMTLNGYVPAPSVSVNM